MNVFKKNGKGEVKKKKNQPKENDYGREQEEVEGI